MMSILSIHNVYTSRARQKPVKDPKQGGTRQFPNFPPNQTLPFKPLSLSLLSGRHFLSHPPETFLRLLRHSFFPGELVASQIHLPARDTVHHSGMAMHSPAAFGGAERPDELCVGLRPLVEVHVGGPDGNTRVTCVVNTVRYANRAHFSGFFRRMRIADHSCVY